MPTTQRHPSTTLTPPLFHTCHEVRDSAPGNFLKGRSTFCYYCSLQIECKCSKLIPGIDDRRIVLLRDFLRPWNVYSSSLSQKGGNLRRFQCGQRSFVFVCHHPSVATMPLFRTLSRLKRSRRSWLSNSFACYMYFRCVGTCFLPFCRSEVDIHFLIELPGVSCDGEVLVVFAVLAKSRT